MAAAGAHRHRIGKLQDSANDIQQNAYDLANDIEDIDKLVQRFGDVYLADTGLCLSKIYDDAQITQSSDKSVEIGRLSRGDRYSTSLLVARVLECEARKSYFDRIRQGDFAASIRFTPNSAIVVRSDPKLPDESIVDAISGLMLIYGRGPHTPMLLSSEAGLHHLLAEHLWTGLNPYDDVSAIGRAAKTSNGNSPAVDAQMKAYTGTGAELYEGNTRYETALQLAHKLVASQKIETASAPKCRANNLDLPSGYRWPDTLFLASGEEENLIAAIAATPLIAHGYPILFVDSDRDFRASMDGGNGEPLWNQVKSFIDDSDIKHVIMLGGTEILDKSGELARFLQNSSDEGRSTVESVVRVDGDDRFAYGVKFAKMMFGIGEMDGHFTGCEIETLAIVNGSYSSGNNNYSDGFQIGGASIDAAVAAPLLALENAFVLYVHADSVPTKVCEFLQDLDRRERPKRLLVLGGDDRIKPSTVDQIASLLRGEGNCSQS